MKLVIFGLAVSSSWGNGHATLWRGLLRALSKRGHQPVFYERDVPYYAMHRDLTDLPGGRLVLYPDWHQVQSAAQRDLRDADVAMVTSYCPDGLAATELVLESPASVHAFYDLDTPVTFARLRAGEPLSYIGPRGLRDFDLVLSYTGGRALDALYDELGARRAVPLYGSVDPALHHPVPPVPDYRADLSYLGTFAADRQQAVEELLVEPARERPELKFLLGGACYPANFPWTANLFLLPHVAPADHPAFYCSSRLTLNVTRSVMAAMGWCPSGRLFEASACGAPIISDAWEGLDAFYAPGSEILIAQTCDDVIHALSLTDAELRRIAKAARERTMSEHTAERRAEELLAALSDTLAAPARDRLPAASASHRTAGL